MITVWDYEQGTEDWLAVRRGLITASAVTKVLSKGAGRESYMNEKLVELDGGIVQPFTTAAMQWGTETEPQARAAYEFNEGTDVVECGFITNDKHPGCGISPDGLIGDYGLLEIKCPNSTTQVQYFRANRLPPEYKAQVMMQLMVTERDWCDFVSFDPRLTKYRYMCVRVERDDKYIDDTLKPGIDKFLVDLQKAMEQTA